MIICYSGKSRLSANLIADEDDDIMIVRSGQGDINWGREKTNARLNADISNCTNKRRMRELFESHDIPMPKYYGPNLSETEHEWRWPIVGRPDRHMKGRGFWLIKNFDDYIRAIQGTRRKKAATHFMEYIESDREYRVHIFKGKSIRISQKLPGGTGSTAHGNYTTIKPTGYYKHVRKAAKQAVAALDLDFGAVDVLATDDRCWVLEVNAAPGLGGTMPKVYAKAFNKWYKDES